MGYPRWLVSVVYLAFSGCFWVGSWEGKERRAKMGKTGNYWPIWSFGPDCCVLASWTGYFFIWSGNCPFAHSLFGHHALILIFCTHSTICALKKNLMIYLMLNVSEKNKWYNHVSYVHMPQMSEIIKYPRSALPYINSTISVFFSSWGQLLCNSIQIWHTSLLWAQHPFSLVCLHLLC